MARKRDIRYQVEIQSGEGSWIGTLRVDKLDTVAYVVSRLTALEEPELGVGHQIIITRVR